MELVKVYFNYFYFARGSARLSLLFYCFNVQSENLELAPLHRIHDLSKPTFIAKGSFVLESAIFQIRYKNKRLVTPFIHSLIHSINICQTPTMFQTLCQRQK